MDDPACYFGVRDPSTGSIIIVGPMPLADLELAVRRAGWAILAALRAVAGHPRPAARA